MFNLLENPQYHRALVNFVLAELECYFLPQVDAERAITPDAVDGEILSNGDLFNLPVKIEWCLSTPPDSREGIGCDKMNDSDLHMQRRPPEWRETPASR